MKTTLLVAFSLAASAMVWGQAVASEANPAGAFDFHAVQLKIVSPDAKQTIGFTLFTVLRDNSSKEINGETRYLDGEHDSESDRLYVGKPGATPTLVTYEHSFFNADGTLLMVDTLNAKSGLASCTSYAAGRKKERKSQLDVPADCFAGASGLMMVVGSLREGISEIRFHAFACAPGPEIFSVKASLPDRSEHWPLYPGDLVRLDMRPDLGALNLLLAPFLPTMDAWFSPNDNWNYVGGEFDRYFRGPHVLTVRVPPAD
ncbi:MAG TPA: hypothetical protein VJW93_15140 [Candidatus Acidoferrales bacterium]|nr:hypothetical protein [Candidatus Acidoferrales bacterium]